jgi:hypothetical protein
VRQLRTSLAPVEGHGRVYEVQGSRREALLVETASKRICKRIRMASIRLWHRTDGSEKLPPVVSRGVHVRHFYCLAFARLSHMETFEVINCDTMNQN